MGKYICQRPIHPGELLKEETEERKLSQRRLAEQMGISYKVLNDILNCRRPITTQSRLLRRQRCSSRQLWVSVLRY